MPRKQGRRSDSLRGKHKERSTHGLWKGQYDISAERLTSTRLSSPKIIRETPDLTITTRGWLPPDANWEYQLVDKFGVPTGETHTRGLAQMADDLAWLAKRKFAEEQRARPKAEGLDATTKARARDELNEWLVRGEFVLERAQQSIAYKIIPEDLPIEAHVLLVLHNWAAVLSHAEVTGADSDDVRLPYPCTIFEFLFRGGVRVIALGMREPDTMFRFFLKTKSAWSAVEYNHLGEIKMFQGINESGNFSKVIEIVWNNIKAICAMLDAQVVETTPTRAPYKRNELRQAHEPPKGLSYHTVSLARRYRVAPLHRPGTEPSHHKRLHFRRGHWRHYEDHKTWIRWTLVGDPDLGFVDKDYHL